MHHVQHRDLRIEGDEDGRDDGEVLRHVVGDREGRERPAGHQELFADAHDLDQLGGIAVEIDHVARFARGIGAGLHGDADVGLGERRRVVGAVAAHRHKPAAGLLLADQAQLGLGRGLGQEVVDARFRRDGRGGLRIVAGNHHGADAHAAQFGETLADAALHHVLQIDDSQHLAVARHCERRAALLGNGAGDAVDLLHRRRSAHGARMGHHGIHRALADDRAFMVDAAHAGLRRESHELPLEVGDVDAAQAILLLRQHDDRAALGRLVRQAGELGHAGHLILVDAAHGEELRGVAVAERDGAGLVEQQRIDIARRLDGAAGRGQHVEAHQAVHAGDADGREQRPDGGGDQRHEQGDEHDHRDRAAGIGGEARDGHHRQHEDDGEAGQQDVQRQLVGRLLARSTLDQGDHAIEEARTLFGRDAHLDAVRQDLGAAGDGRAVAARLADDGRRFAGDGRFVDGGHTLDDLAVTRDDVAGLDQDDLADLQRMGPHRLEDVAHAHQDLGDGFAAHTTQRVRLGLAAALGHRLGEGGEQHRHPQPGHDLDLEADAGRAHNDVTHHQHGGDQRHQLDGEHHRVLHQFPGMQLGEACHQGGLQDGRVEQRLRLVTCAHDCAS